MSSNRVLGFTALALGALGVVLVLLFSASGGTTLHAVFEDSGQLVTGGQVQVAGRSVGSITGLSLTGNGLADVTMSIDDGSVLPLHHGTRAIIRAVGQAGVDNRFVQLIPGASSVPELADGATLPTSQTTGIVDLDAVLDSFGPSTRASLAQLITHSSQAFAGSGARWFNRMLAGLDPALGELDGLSAQLASDRVELSRLVQTGAVASHAVASRSPALQDSVAAAAHTFGEVAQQRAALADLLARAPAVLRQANGTLARVSVAVTTLRPTLRAVVPLTPSLRQFLGLLPPTLDELTPTVARLNGELPALLATLRGFEPLAAPAVNGLRSAAASFTGLMPFLVGLREYGSDIVLGIFNGLGGLVSGPYAAVGHYAKLNFVQSAQTLFSGPLSQLFSNGSLLPGNLAVRTHLLARCPGGDAPPAPDGSNPWVPSRSLCNPANDTPLSVDFPR